MRQTKHLTILLADDNPDDRVLVKRLLRAEFPGFQALEVRTQAELDRALKAGGFDAVVTDYHLHWTDGLQVLSAVKARYPDVPVIMLTGTGTEEVAVEGMKQGLTDYLLKKHMARLPAALRLALERAEARKRAAEMETRLQTLLDQLNVGVFRLSRRGKLLDANRAALRLLGLRSVEEARQMDPAEIFAHPQERLSLVKRAMKERGLRNCPVQLRRTDGRLVWVSLTVTVSHQASGGVVVEGLLEDITEQKRAQVEIEAAHEYLRTLHESCPDAIIATNTDGRISVFNPGAEEMLGYRSEETLGHPVVQLYPNRDDARAVMRAMRSGPEGVVRNLETMLRHKDGRLIPVLLSAAILRDAEGNEQGTAGYIKDITGRKRVEQRLRLQATALEAAANGIVIADRDGNILWVNPAFTRLTGYDTEELLGQDPRIFRPDKHAPVLSQELWDTILAGQVWHGEITNQRKDGSLYHEEMTITPVRNDAGEITNFIAIVQDVTERVQTAETLRRRDAILSAVAFAAAQFLRATHWGQDIQEVLARLCRAAEASRAYIVENQTDEAGALLAFMRFEWAAPGIEPQTTKPVLQGFPWDAGGFDRWADTLAGGKPVSGPVHGFPLRERAIFDHLDIRSIAVAPVFVGSEWWGVLGLDECLVEREWSSAEMDALKAAADTLGAAIQNARLLEAERASREQAVALREATQTISSSLDLNETLHQILEQLKRVLAYDSVSVFIFEDEMLEVVVSAGFADMHLTSTVSQTLLKESPILRQMARDLQPVVTDDVRSLEGWILVPGTEHVRSWMGIPLVVKGRMIGALTIDNNKAGFFGEKDVRVAQTLAQHVAQAIENARLHQEIRKQAQQLQQILDTTPQGILLLDEKHRIEMANPTGTQYLPSLTDRKPGERLTHLGNRSLEQILASQPGEIPYEVSGLAPAKRQFEVGASPLTADGPGSGGWVLVLRDVTGERAVQERIQQQERLAAVGQLAAGIAHDFNNLLQGIIGFADLLQHKPNLDDSTRHGLEVIATQGQRAAQLVRQILDFSRRSVTNQQPLDLLELATETVRLLRRTLPGNIRITLDHDLAGGFVVQGDVGQLQQVLTNLAVNARDAMPDGGTLHLHLAGVDLHTGDPTPFPEMKLGKWVTLAVSDSGTGIPAEALPHLFEPFFTTKEVGKGSGLGLAQVYGIVRQHEGYIDVTSEENQGTTFTIYLPAWHEPPAGSDLPDWESIPHGHGEVILVVDDDPSVRQVCQAMVESLGYETLSAGNGREAIAIYAEHHSDIALVLSDIVMPAMGGVELARELQQIDPAAKVVLITGYPLGQAQRGLQAEGVMDWIQKPLSLSELGEKLKRAMGDGEQTENSRM